MSRRHSVLDCSQLQRESSLCNGLQPLVRKTVRGRQQWTGSLRDEDGIGMIDLAKAVGLVGGAEDGIGVGILTRRVFQ